MTATRIMALLCELRCLEQMAEHLATFTARRDTRDAWRLVLVAIDDRIALLNGALALDVDAATLAACELHLAQEEHVRRDSQEANASHLATSADLTRQPRVTIH